MGLYLSKPLTTKFDDVQSSDRLAACSTDMQGWRIYMEDAHIMYLDNDKEMNGLALFGVFDGHGGPAVSRWVAMNFLQAFNKMRALNEAHMRNNTLVYKIPVENLPEKMIAPVAQTLEDTFLEIDEQLRQTSPEFEQDLRVIQATAMRLRKIDMAVSGIEEPSSGTFFKDLIDGKKWTVSSGEHGEKQTDDQANKYIVDKDKTFAEIYEDERRIDNEMTLYQRQEASVEDFNVATGAPEKKCPYDPQSCGCTAVVAAILTEPTPVLVVANAGDSRCVLARNGAAVRMTVDHKPLQTRERNRILAAGGTVTNGRVDSNLNLSRSLGDLHYKRDLTRTPDLQKISPVPDVTFIPLTNEDEFVILACDGIWDILSEQDVVGRVCELWALIKNEMTNNGETLSDAEICKQIAQQLCDHCIAPTPFDSETGGAGCDNMTAMVIRVKDEWRRQLSPPDKDIQGHDESKLYGTEELQEDYKLTDIHTE